MLTIAPLRRITTLRPIAGLPTAAASRRPYSADSKTADDDKTAAPADKVKQTVDKVEHTAEDIVKKVTDLETQVKDLKVSTPVCSAHAQAASPGPGGRITNPVPYPTLPPPPPQSQLTYGKADFINLQRRTEQEKTATREFAIQAFAGDLLSTVDILTTALSHVPQPIPSDAKDLIALYSGVQMTRGELLKTLAKHGVTPFNPTGEKFDPMRHEAVFQAPRPDKEAGTVFETQKEGYMLKSRTLRPAQVGVVQDTSSSSSSSS
ncbi:hypothetical protein QFC22_000651 [Naganishia vaughanmartiniae]|uniref:Uncharacterized protein n=1 Tax=Naganishia vaughanmartiniae TaxID=1424756 RepID=A0ACC2XQ16_9TREE|nr:hypothetical protein QFC22_000651 [Naganishia vaughanmartiniae]